MCNKSYMRHWQMLDKRTLWKINRLVQDIERNGVSTGIGRAKTVSDISEVLSVSRAGRPASSSAKTMRRVRLARFLSQRVD